MADAPKPKAPKAAKPPPAHPPYVTMITDAIKSLKERDGSSVAAIKKFIDDKYGKVRWQLVSAPRGHAARRVARTWVLAAVLGAR